MNRANSIPKLVCIEEDKVEFVCIWDNIFSNVNWSIERIGNRPCGSPAPYPQTEEVSLFQFRLLFSKCFFEILGDENVTDFALDLPALLRLGKEGVSTAL